MLPKPLACLRCEHQWYPRNVGVRPRICPRCKSAYWDTARTNLQGTTPEVNFDNGTHMGEVGSSPEPSGSGSSLLPEKGNGVAFREPGWEPPPWFVHLQELEGFKHRRYTGVAPVIEKACKKAGVDVDLVAETFADYYAGGGAAKHGWSDPVMSLHRTIEVQISKVRTRAPKQPTRNQRYPRTQGNHY